MNIFPSMSMLRICSPNNNSKFTLALCLLQVATYWTIITIISLFNDSNEKWKKKGKEKKRLLFFFSIGWNSYLVCAFNNSNVITISSECVITIWSKSSDFFGQLRANKDQIQLSALQKRTKKIIFFFSCFEQLQRIQAKELISWLFAHTL